MAISAIQNYALNWSQSRDNMREALGVLEDAEWIRYMENPNLLGENLHPVWVELADLLETQAMEAIGQTEAKY